MSIFITGTDTDIGKTLISSWLCLHSGFDYYKPIQTGAVGVTDSQTVQKLSGANIQSESYLFKDPLSPHIAAANEKQKIHLSKIHVLKKQKTIIEGAGGVMVPINENQIMLDLIKLLNVSVILVASSKLGTINHSLLSINALRAKKIDILGVIISGEPNLENKKSIEHYGRVRVLAELPFVENVNKNELSAIPLTNSLIQILKRY